MMKKILLIILMVFCFYCCKNETNYNNNSELCSLLAEMTENDQRIRKLPEMTDPFFKILDSIILANYTSKYEYADLPRDKKLEWGKIARKIADKKTKAPKKITDSLWEIQSKIDIENTKTLIDITKKRGWVSKKQLKCKNYISPVLIFRHAPEKFWKDLKPLIEKEFKAGRMNSGDYWFINNHINGRPTDFGNGFEIIEN
ncbi:hypothetical protein [Mesonia mobilis]|uniref:Lipoprotein n=1 Tax=Mesonia mobilis TaxID=369791 RepID=A0ABQ3C518_9FLAO|nr:hypothetical protein [Mesonia mobilis]GGZ65759.1 hypothetical protein GCM10008088_28670 [Mesonia mobilis]